MPLTTTTRPRTGPASLDAPLRRKPRWLDARAQLADYLEYHRSAANKWTHYIGIPLIVIGILNFLWQVKLFAIAPGWTLTLAVPVFVLFAGFYAMMSVPLGAAMLVFFAGLYAIAAFIGNVWVALGLFVLGWVLQFVGHGLFEKRAPAFTKNLLHLLVGPMWIVNRWLNAVGVYPLGRPDRFVVR